MKHVVNLWSSMPQELMEEDSIAMVKMGLDKLIDNRTFGDVSSDICKPVMVDANEGNE